MDARPPPRPRGRRSAGSRRMTDHEAELVVATREFAADGVLALTLRHPLGEQLPVWEPGAHIDVLLGPGLERQYSLCGDPADRTAWRIAVLREPDGRGGSAYVHGQLEQGDKVRVRGPRNHFRLEPAPATASSRAASASHPCSRCWPPPRQRAPSGACSTAVVPATPWRSPRSWRATATASPSLRRTRPGCSTCPPSSTTSRTAPSSTAAVPGRCSTRSRHDAPAATSCAWSGSSRRSKWWVPTASSRSCWSRAAGR